MTKPIWRKGPPPSAGWWPASLFRHAEALRWYDGVKWSMECYAEYPIATVDQHARMVAKNQSKIEWTYRPASWPQRSRT